jgi:hypothetical protein
MIAVVAGRDNKISSGGGDDSNAAVNAGRDNKISSGVVTIPILHLSR